MLHTSAAIALCGMPWLPAWVRVLSARLVAPARAWLISMPRDQASVWVAWQCCKASSRAIRAVPM
eukprot:11801228-Prorocentrum_lima.AAC.1